MNLRVAMAAASGGGSRGTGDGPQLGSKRAKASKLKATKQSSPRPKVGPRPSIYMERFVAGGGRSEQ